MKNIAYFSNQFSSKHGHGIARYSKHLFSAMQSLASDIKVTPVAAWSDLENNELRALQSETDLNILKLGRRGVAGLWTYLNFPPLEWLLKDRIDLVHAVALGYPIATNKPFVVTIHDLGPLTHPHFFSDTPPWLMERSLKQTVKKALAFICVSQSTANELLNYVLKQYSQDISDRIKVIHEGVSPFFGEKSNVRVLEKRGSFDPYSDSYILAAGKLSPRKNFPAILQALAMVKDKIDHHLLVVGGNGWDHEQIVPMAHELGLSDRVHFMGYVSDEVLRALYQSADLFVYPSLYEGFGLTVLEAMAASCPVLTSDRTSLPEIAGDAALIVDPTDTVEMSRAILEICSDRDKQNYFKKKGLARIAEFSWDEAARKVMDLYAEVLSYERK